jgi:alkylation response protein AidB-like acyl-CoA dehydrogenase
LNFDYSEEQELLAASVKRFVAKDYSFDARAKIIASAQGYSDVIWSTFADIGLLGLPLPTAVGGYGGSALDMMIVMEAIGEALVVEPYLSTVGLGARFVARGGSPQQQEAILPRVIAGDIKLAFAHTEDGARYNLAHVATRATPTDGGFSIDGVKRVVLDAPSADKLLVSARTAGNTADHTGISLVVVDTVAPGVAMNAYRTIDGLRAADVTFNAVPVGRDALIGVADQGHMLIEEMVDYAIAQLCAEAVGAMQYANHATLEYLKTRKQFGVTIGSFQALQHRMVDMVICAEQARSMASLACAKVDAGNDPSERRRVVSAAKIKIADACRHVAQESVQLHGGMGMSDELKISHTFRRLTMIAQQFGDADYHLERFAAVH